MSEDKKDNSKTLSLSLGKSASSGTVKQSLSRGRSKTVTVEVKKGRNFKLTKKDDSQDDSGLSNAEKEARLKAIQEAEEKKNNETEEVQVFSKSSIEVEESATDKIKSIEAEEKKAKESAKKKFEKKSDPAQKKEEVTLDELLEKSKESASKKTAKEEFEKELESKKKQVSKPRGGHEDKWEKKKLTISTALDFDSEERVRSLASIQRAKEKKKKSQNTGEQEFAAKEIIIPEIISVQELANRMQIRVQDVMKELMKLGMMKRQADEIDADTAEIIVSEFNHIPKRVLDSDIEDLLSEEEVSDKDLVKRPPVVTIMGHVDHGKTSLLDAFRESNVTDGEAGGITQHIGAYQVTTKNGEKVTFIDTPGHAAFTEMRARGANMTDIVILIVAADDGIMPQTAEAINHAKAAEVPIIVAVNKIDKPDANPKKVKDELLTHELVPEEYGGDIQVVEISAKEKTNLDGLLDAILLQAEVLELKDSSKQTPRGSVVEARVDKGKGVVATLLVQKGTLRKGDIIIAGTGFGKVKSISDENGNILEEAGPARPVEMLGFDEVPAAGEIFANAKSEKDARDVIEYRKKVQLLEKQKSQAAGSLDSLFKQAKGDNKELNIIVKGDVHGSIEAVNSTINKIESEEVKIKIVHSAAGAITESDTQLAMATGAVIFGFNVRAEAKAKEVAEKENIDIRYYNIIYNLIDDLKALVSGMLSPIIREELIGYAEIQQVFKITKSGKIAGCKITEGTVKRGSGVRLLRDNVVIHEGKLKTLKRFKDEVAEVKEGYECGMAFENYEDIKEGDFIECFEIVEEQRQLAE